jgi:nucleoside recognition membrane protein YjiH
MLVTHWIVVIVRLRICVNTIRQKPLNEKSIIFYANDEGAVFRPSLFRFDFWKKFWYYIFTKNLEERRI